MANQALPPADQLKEYNRLKTLIGKYRRYLKHLVKTQAAETKIEQVSIQLSNLEAQIAKVPEQARVTLKEPPPPAPTPEPEPTVPAPRPPTVVPPYARYENDLFRSMTLSLKRLHADLDIAVATRAGRGETSAIEHQIAVTQFNLRVLGHRLRALRSGSLPAPDPGLIQASAGIPIAGVAYLYSTTRKAVDSLVANALQASPNTQFKTLYADRFAVGSDVQLTSREPDLTLTRLPGRGVGYSNGVSLHSKGPPTGALTEASLFGPFPTPHYRFLTAAIITRSAYPHIIREATFELRAQYLPIVHCPGISHQGEGARTPIRLNCRQGWAPAGELTLPMRYPSSWRIYAFGIDMRAAWYTQGYGANYPLDAYKIPYRVRIQDNICATTWSLTLDFWATQKYILDLDSVLIVNYGEQLYLR